MDGLTAMMSEGGLADPEGTARKAMSLMIHRQAAVLSFGDAFAVLAMGCWFAVGLAFFVRPGPAMGAPPQGGGH